MRHQTNQPTTQLVPASRKGGLLRGRQKHPEAIELHAVSVRPSVHYTRPWSASDEPVPFAFRLAVLPLRAVALYLLWATSSPRRLAVAVTLLGVVAVVVLA